MREIWKDIPGYEGSHKCSNLGRVKSIDHFVKYKSGQLRFHKGKMLSAWIETGYLRVGLRKNCKQRMYFIHVIVAKTFIYNPKNKSQVNHKDGNKLNNNKSNLEWNTSKENCDHARHILKTPGGHFKKVLNTVTNTLYNSAKEAHIAENFKHSYSFTTSMLNGTYKNKTNLIYGLPIL